MDQLLRVDEVCELTGLTPTTLRYWRTQKPPVGPKSAKLGRRIVYRRADVEAWVDEQFAEADGKAS